MILIKYVYIIHSAFDTRIYQPVLSIRKLTTCQKPILGELKNDKTVYGVINFDHKLVFMKRLEKIQN